MYGDVKVDLFFLSPFIFLALRIRFLRFLFSFRCQVRGAEVKPFMLTAGPTLSSQRIASLQTSAAELSLSTTSHPSRLSIDDQQPAQSSRRTSRRGSQIKRGSVISLAPVRVPVWMEEVASRIGDAAEGTILDWPWDQPFVDRLHNVHLTLDEIKARYGNRTRDYVPDFDGASQNSSDDASDEGSHPTRTASPPSTSNRRKKVTSNSQLIAEVRAAKKMLKRRLRREAARSRFLQIVKQWKARVVDFTPKSNAGNADFQFDISLDPAHLHSEAMRTILDEEREIADQLIVTFQRMARDAEKRRAADELTKEAAQAQELQRTDRDTSVTTEQPSAFRALEHRVPLSLRLTQREVDPISGAAGTSLASNLEQERYDQVVPKLPLLPFGTAAQRSRARETIATGDHRPRPPVLPSVASATADVNTASSTAAHFAVKKAPWSQKMDDASQPTAGFEGINDALFQSKDRRHDSCAPPCASFAPSSSSQVDAAIRAMVEASQVAANRRRGSKRSSSFGLDGEAMRASTAEHQDAGADGRETPSELPEDFSEMHLPHDAGLLATLHDVLMERGKDELALTLPPSLLCCVTGKIMLEPTIVTDDMLASNGRPAGVTLERDVWRQIQQMQLDGTLSVDRLPQSLRDLLVQSEARRLPLHSRANIDVTKSLIAWRSTVLCELVNRSLVRLDALSVTRVIVNSIVQDAIEQTSSFMHASHRAAKGAVLRARYPVSMSQLRCAALESKRKITSISTSLCEVRTAVEQLLRSCAHLDSKRGVLERELTRRAVHLAKAPMATDAADVHAEIDALLSQIAHVDVEVDEAATLLLSMERRFALLRSQYVVASKKIDEYNSHVAPYNEFMERDRQQWGPVYKASIAACYSVIKRLFDRTLEVAPDNRLVINKIADYADEASIRDLMTHLPELLLRYESKMKQARVPLDVLPLSDAAFVLLNKDATVEDTQAFERLPYIAYIPPTEEAPLMSLQQPLQSVRAGAEMLRRSTLVPLPPVSPRSQAHGRQHTRSEQPKMQQDDSPRIIRPAGSDTRIPFWHFVRNPCRSGNVEAKQAVKESRAPIIPTASPNTAGKPLATPEVSAAAAAKPTTLGATARACGSGNEFLAMNFVHTRKLTRKAADSNSGSPDHIASVFPQHSNFRLQLGKNDVTDALRASALAPAQ